MKLKQKLLPLFGLSVLAATTMPLVLSSCANGTNTDGGCINMLDRYWDKAIKHSPESFTTDQANDTLINDCKENIDILKSEILSSYSAYTDMWMNSGPFTEEGVERPTKIWESDVKLSDLEIFEQKCDFGDGEFNVPTLTYRMEGRVTWSTYGLCKLSDRVRSDKSNGISTYCYTNYLIDFINLPIVVGPEATNDPARYSLPTHYGFYPYIYWMVNPQYTVTPPKEWRVRLNLNVNTKRTGPDLEPGQLKDVESFSEEYDFRMGEMNTWSEKENETFRLMVADQYDFYPPGIITNKWAISPLVALPPAGFMSLYFADTNIPLY